jgi:hypothetical protein
MINVSSRGGRRGVVRERAAVENAVMAVREGKAMAERRERE